MDKKVTIKIITSAPLLLKKWSNYDIKHKFRPFAVAVNMYNISSFMSVKTEQTQMACRHTHPLHSASIWSLVTLLTKRYSCIQLSHPSQLKFTVPPPIILHSKLVLVSSNDTLVSACTFPSVLREIQPSKLSGRPTPHPIQVSKAARMKIMIQNVTSKMGLVKSLVMPLLSDQVSQRSASLATWHRYFAPGWTTTVKLCSSRYRRWWATITFTESASILFRYCCSCVWWCLMMEACILLAQGTTHSFTTSTVLTWNTYQYSY